MRENLAHMQLQIGMPAPNFVVSDTHGEPVPFADLWSSGPTLLTFLRHFGWIFCREWLAQLELHQAELTRAGLRTIGVGMGEPKHAQRYCGKLAPSITCLTDNSTLPYQRYGLHRGSLGELMSPGVFVASIRALSRGSSQGTPVGDPKMLPGTFIVNTHGIIRYAYYSTHAGDHPKICALITVAHTLAS